MLKILFLSLIMISSEVFASYDAGRVAYDHGDYTQAYKLWLDVTRAKSGSLNNSFEWTRPSNEQKRDAQYAIAVLYCLGKGVEQNYKQAAKWLKLAIEAGHIQAQLKLGFFYLQGKGIKKNEVKARQLFLIAAEHGFVDAQFNIGIMYLKGVGGEQNISKAKYWLKSAALQGDQDAFDELINFQAMHNKKIQANNIETQNFENSSVRVFEDKTKYPNEFIGETTGDEITDKSLVFKIDKKIVSQAGNASELAETISLPITKPNIIPTIQQGLILHEPMWLLKQMESTYAIQIVAMTNLEKLKNFTRGLSAKGDWAYFVKKKGVHKYYILLNCCFSDKKSAKKAQISFPLEIKKLQSFLVHLKQIQHFINASQE